MEPSIPHGIAPFDLAAATRNLAEDIARQAKYAGPLSMPLSGAQRDIHEARIRREDQEREQRVTRAAADAAARWAETAARLDGNAPALAALNRHQPQPGYSRVVCSECRESDLDDTVPVAWECGTYTVIKGAALESAGEPEPHRIALSVRVKPPGAGGSYTVTHPAPCHRLPYGEVCDFDMTWWRSKPELPELGVYDAVARDGTIEFVWVRGLEATDWHG